MHKTCSTFRYYVYYVYYVILCGSTINLTFRARGELAAGNLGWSSHRPVGVAQTSTGESRNISGRAPPAAKFCFWLTCFCVYSVFCNGFGAICYGHWSAVHMHFPTGPCMILCHSFPQDIFPCSVSTWPKKKADGPWEALRAPAYNTPSPQ